MESVMHRIRFLYREMGRGEKKIADYLLEHVGEIVGLSISTLAEACGCGEATVVRFARRLGFDGYQSLKIRIAQEMNASSVVSREISPEDSCFDIFCKQMREITVTLQNTESVLDPAQLEAAAQKLMNARRIAVFGLGNSAAIATDAAHKFLRLGLDAQACCDNHLQAIIASHLDRSSVAVGVSHSGASKDIVEALRLSKIGGACTICITSVGASPLVEAADIALFTKSEETEHSILAVNSRIAQLAIIDAIYSYIVVRADKASMQAIYNTEVALQDKKY